MQKTLLSPWIFVAAVAVLSCHEGAHAGNYSGVIATSTTWTAAGNPYVVTAPLRFASNTLWTVGAGVDIQVQGNAPITVQGAMTALGTAASPIRFRPVPGNGSGAGLAVSNTETNEALFPVVTLRHCEFTALTNVAIAVYFAHTHLTLDACTFTNFTMSVVRAATSRVVIVNNVSSNTGESLNVVDCAGVVGTNSYSYINGYADAIDIDGKWPYGGDETMTVEGNTLAHAADVDADGIDLGVAFSVVRNNRIDDFGDKGLSIGEYTDALFINNVITRCTIGMAIKDYSTPVILNCTVADCDRGVAGYAKYFGPSAGGMTNCIIWNCGTGIELLDGSTLAVGSCDVDGNSVWPGPGNFNLDPRFVDAAARNLRLRSDSPCLDAAVSSPRVTDDLDSVARPLDGNGDGLARPDLGGYESLPVPVGRRYVRAGNPGAAYPYDTWANAAATIVDATDMALPGEDVVVSNGVYLLDRTIVVTHPIRVVSVNGPGVTVVDGNEAVRCFLISNAQAVVSGFRIIRGATNASGGGVWLAGGGTLTDCAVVSNRAVGVGADGGGVHIVGTGTVDRCVLQMNQAEDDGGAIDCDGAGYRIENCVMEGNTAGHRAGGVYQRDRGTVVNCTVVGNMGQEGGGNWLGANARLLNTVLYYNVSPTGANWLVGTAATNLDVRYCVSQPAYTNGPGHSSADPRFAGSNDWHLLVGSSCIDAGTRDAAPRDDLDGAGRPVDGNGDSLVATDIGAYERAAPAGADSDLDGVPDVWELAQGLDVILADGLVDDDGDGVVNAAEYAADTGPRDGASYLRVTGAGREPGGLRLAWAGGTQVRQYIERRTNLLAGGESWQAIYTNSAPTAVTNEYLLAPSMPGFYRVRAVRE